MEATDLRGVNILDADLFSTDLTKTKGPFETQVNKRLASIWTRDCSLASSVQTRTNKFPPRAQNQPFGSY